MLAYCSNGGTFHVSILWDKTTRASTVLDLLPGTVTNYAYGTNDLGEVVGCCEDSSGQYILGDHAYLWDRTHGIRSLEDPAIFPGNPGWRLANANAINVAGVIIGSGINPAGEIHAFSAAYDRTLGQVTSITDLGHTQGTTQSDVQALNAGGAVIGVSWIDGTSNSSNPFYYDSARGRVDLGPLVTSGNLHASGLNDSSQVALQEPLNGKYRAFYWDATRTSLLNLGTLGGTSAKVEVYGNTYHRSEMIKKDGRIVGNSNLSGDRRQGSSDPTRGPVQTLDLHELRLPAPASGRNKKPTLRKAGGKTSCWAV